MGGFSIFSDRLFLLVYVFVSLVQFILKYFVPFSTNFSDSLSLKHTHIILYFDCVSFNLQDSFSGFQHFMILGFSTCKIKSSASTDTVASYFTIGHLSIAPICCELQYNDEVE